MKKKKLIVAIDGYSSTGKSTLAKRLAKELGYTHIDSGAMYRAVTLYVMQNKLFSEDENLTQKHIVANLDNIKIRFQINPKTHVNEIHLNNKNVEQEIRSMEVSENVSKVAKISEVRTAMVKKQRELAQLGGIIMDGRDIGTTVFPDADVKIFLTASAEERAKRRFEELRKKGVEVSLEEVVKNINERDFTDVNRLVSPLKQAQDAIVVDNGKLTVEETQQQVLNIINYRVK